MRQKISKMLCLGRNIREYNQRLGKVPVGYVSCIILSSIVQGAGFCLLAGVWALLIHSVLTPFSPPLLHVALVLPVVQLCVM